MSDSSTSETAAPSSTSTTPDEPQLVTAALQAKTARVGDRLAITVKNVTDGPVSLTESYLPLRRVSEGGPDTMIWAVPLGSTHQEPNLVRDGKYSVNDIGPEMIPSPMEPGVSYADELTVPEVPPGTYEFIVPACAGNPWDDCETHLTGGGIQGGDCYIHKCPAQTFELEFTVIE